MVSALSANETPSFGVGGDSISLSDGQDLVLLAEACGADQVLVKPTSSFSPDSLGSKNQFPPAPGSADVLVKAVNGENMIVEEAIVQRAWIILYCVSSFGIFVKSLGG